MAGPHILEVSLATQNSTAASAAAALKQLPVITGFGALPVYLL